MQAFNQHQAAQARHLQQEGFKEVTRVVTLDDLPNIFEQPLLLLGKPTCTDEVAVIRLEENCLEHLRFDGSYGTKTFLQLYQEYQDTGQIHPDVHIYNDKAHLLPIAQYNLGQLGDGNYVSYSKNKDGYKEQRSTSNVQIGVQLTS